MLVWFEENQNALEEKKMCYATGTYMRVGVYIENNRSRVWKN